MSSSVFSAEVTATLRNGRTARRRSVEIDGQGIDVQSPFPSPEDWRDRWVYFALIDRFCRSSGPPQARWDRPFGGFQGGTLEGLRSKLGYLQRLGVGAIWISPALQNCQAQDGTYHG